MYASFKNICIKFSIEYAILDKMSIVYNNKYVRDLLTIFI